MAEELLMTCSQCDSVSSARGGELDPIAILVALNARRAERSQGKAMLALMQQAVDFATQSTVDSDGHVDVRA